MVFSPLLLYASGALSMFPHHHKNHDRRTEDSCYRADTQFRRGKDRPRQPVAEQAEHASAQETARNQHQRSCIGKQPADQMRNRDSNKGNQMANAATQPDKMLDKITIKKRRCATLTPMLFAYVSPSGMRRSVWITETPLPLRQRSRPP